MQHANFLFILNFPKCIFEFNFIFSVSFQQHPPVNRSYSASFPSRRAPAGTPIIVPAPVPSNPALTPAQLQEKRSQSSSGIVSGADSRGIKRRLIRTTSAPLKE